MSGVQLLLLDDHDLFRASLAHLLASQTEFSVVANCGVAEDALAVLGRLPVDVVLLDYDLGMRTGFDFIRQARSAGYQNRIFLVVAAIPADALVHALGMGVCGAFLKSGSPEMLASAIRTVMRGETWIDPQCIEALDRALHQTKETSADGNKLTDRERRVLRGIFDGLSNKQIATDLSLSEASVKSALQQLFLKTGVRTRSQLVRVALEEYGDTWRRS